MSKIIKTGEANGHKNRRRAGVIALLVGVLIVGAGVGGYVWLTSHKKVQPQDTLTKAANAESLRYDDRSAAVKVAAQTAGNQEASGDVDGAVTTLKGVLPKATNDTEKVSLYIQLALVYANAKRSDEAVASAQSAIALDPKNWRLYKNLGSVYDALGDSAKAKDSYTQADTLLKDTSDYTTYHNELQGLIRNAGAGQ